MEHAIHIYENVWLGDAEGAEVFKNRISVRGEDTCMETDGKTPYAILRTIYLGSDMETQQLINAILDDIEAKNKEGSVIVHCTSGIDRSPFIVMCWLVLRKDWTVEEAYSYIKQQRPIIVEHYDWVRLLRDKNILPELY